jgi:hypothetical protein
MNNTERNRFVGKIKGLAEQTRLARKCIAVAAKAKKEKAVWSFTDTKRGLGVDARHHLLAYGFFRGVPYLKMERACRDDNRPNAQAILNILAVHVHPWQLEKQYTLEKINAWLANTSFTPVAQPAREKRPYAKPVPTSIHPVLFHVDMIDRIRRVVFGSK